MQTIPEVSYSLILPTFLLFADSLVDSPILKSKPSLEGFGLNGRHFILTSSAKAETPQADTSLLERQSAHPQSPACLLSSPSSMIGLCVHGGWPLATGLTVKEPEHCLCGERHGFKEVSTYLSSAVTSACSEQAHTHSFAPRGQLCYSPRSTQALHTSPHEGHSIAIVRTSNVRSVHQVPCHLKPLASSCLHHFQTNSSKHLFFSR